MKTQIGQQNTNITLGPEEARTRLLQQFQI